MNYRKNPVGALTDQIAQGFREGSKAEGRREGIQEGLAGILKDNALARSLSLLPVEQQNKAIDNYYKNLPPSDEKYKSQFEAPPPIREQPRTVTSPLERSQLMQSLQGLSGYASPGGGMPQAMNQMFSQQTEPMPQPSAVPQMSPLEQKNMMSRLSGLASYGQGLPPSMQQQMPQQMPDATRFNQEMIDRNRPPIAQPRAQQELNAQNLARFQSQLPEKQAERYDNLLKVLNNEGKQENNAAIKQATWDSVEDRKRAQEARTAESKGEKKKPLTEDVMDELLRLADYDPKKARALGVRYGYDMDQFA